MNVVFIYWFNYYISEAADKLTENGKDSYESKLMSFVLDW